MFPQLRSTTQRLHHAHDDFTIDHADQMLETHNLESEQPQAKVEHNQTPPDSHASVVELPPPHPERSHPVISSSTTTSTTESSFFAEEEEEEETTQSPRTREKPQTAQPVQPAQPKTIKLEKASPEMKDSLKTAIDNALKESNLNMSASSRNANVYLLSGECCQI